MTAELPAPPVGLVAAALDVALQPASMPRHTHKAAKNRLSINLLTARKLTSNNGIWLSLVDHALQIPPRRMRKAEDVAKGHFERLAYRAERSERRSSTSGEEVAKRSLIYVGLPPEIPAGPATKNPGSIDRCDVHGPLS